MELSITIFKVGNCFVGRIKEFPANLTQGKTINSSIKNLADALHLYMQDVSKENETVTEFS